MKPANKAKSKNSKKKANEEQVQCCSRDHNKDGNCDIHSAPGVSRSREAVQAYRQAFLRGVNCGLANAVIIANWLEGPIQDDALRQIARARAQLTGAEIPTTTPQDTRKARHEARIRRHSI